MIVWYPFVEHCSEDPFLAFRESVYRGRGVCSHTRQVFLSLQVISYGAKEGASEEKMRAEATYE